jgi:hypothetical protein
MEINAKLLAPCGLYCGVCAVFCATEDNNEKFRERLLGVYKGKLPNSENLTVEDIRCEGCLSEQPFLYCKACPIRECSKSKGYTGCHECDDFPCPYVEQFPIPLGKKVMMRAIPYWRQVGTERFVDEEQARHLCPECGHKLFRGAKRCNQCKVEVDLD